MLLVFDLSDASFTEQSIKLLAPVRTSVGLLIPEFLVLQPFSEHVCALATAYVILKTGDTHNDPRNATGILSPLELCDLGNDPRCLLCL